MSWGIRDGSRAWLQPFKYSELAHVIIPACFYWESPPGSDFQYGKKTQDLAALAKRLNGKGIPHEFSELVVEYKCY